MLILKKNVQENVFLANDFRGNVFLRGVRIPTKILRTKFKILTKFLMFEMKSLPSQKKKIVKLRMFLIKLFLCKQGGYENLRFWTDALFFTLQFSLKTKKL